MIGPFFNWLYPRGWVDATFMRDQLNYLLHYREIISWNLSGGEVMSRKCKQDWNVEAHDLWPYNILAELFSLQDKKHQGCYILRKCVGWNSKSERYKKKKKITNCKMENCRNISWRHSGKIIFAISL